MGEAFAGLVRVIRGLFTWWVVVAPWESGLRSRGGRRAVELKPGVHLRLPSFDRIYVQSVRTRTSQLHVQTITTLDGLTVTVSGNLKYHIEDLPKLYNTLDHGEDTIEAIAMGVVAETIAGLKREQCTPSTVTDTAESHLDLTPYGIGADIEITLTTFAFVRTYRLIMDNQHTGYGNALDTSNPVNVGSYE